MVRFAKTEIELAEFTSALAFLTDSTGLIGNILTKFPKGELEPHTNRELFRSTLNKIEHLDNSEFYGRFIGFHVKNLSDFASNFNPKLSLLLVSEVSSQIVQISFESFLYLFGWLGREH